MDHPDSEPLGVGRLPKRNDLPPHLDPTGIRSRKTERQMHQGRLPRPVLSQQAVNFTTGQNKIGSVECYRGAEPFPDLGELENRRQSPVG